MASLRQRIAIHEAAHVVVAARYGIPVSYAVLDNANPHMWHGHYRIPHPRLALKRMVRLCLAAGG